MDRNAPGFRLRWLMLPVAWVLLVSSLSLPHQPYTGISLPPSGRVGAVDPGSPGDAAGIRPGDLLLPAEDPERNEVLAPGALDAAEPGVPLVVRRERDGERETVWLVPQRATAAERRFQAIVFAVAASFFLLGGWVWGERRDPLTRTFYLLCLAFTVVIAPRVHVLAGPANHVYEALVMGSQIFFGPLFSHFFALFPESGRPRARWWVLATYAAATVLFVCYVAMKLGGLWRLGQLEPLLAVLNTGLPAVASAGLLGGLVLFGWEFFRAETSDARRRLRVAFIGTLIGALPVTLLIGMHNLSAAPSLPGERWAVPLIVLVPLSFGWAMSVHNVFDFRVALRAATRAIGALAGAGVLYVAGE